MMDSSHPVPSAQQGLTLAEVRAQRQRFGSNEFSAASFRSRFLTALKFLTDPMGLMLLVLALIYFLLQKNQEAWLMLIAFVPVSLVDVILELRAEKALSSLRATFQPRAKVWRDGVLQEVPTREIVPGDWVALEEGQTIPADGTLRTASNLSVSEASLTGESMPIQKSMNEEVFAGTTVLTGRGVCEITQTGLRSKFGKIIALVGVADSGSSPLQKKVKHFVSLLMKFAAILVLGLLVLEWSRGKPILEALLVSLTFGMASVPEEFPLVFTLYLSLGAWRLSRRGVLVKSLPAVETLGSVNVICTDKTGTLTEGRFQLTDFVSMNHDIPVEQQWRFALLACEPVVVDAMESAIWDQARKKWGNTLELFELKNETLIHDYLFEPEGKHMSHVWQSLSGAGHIAMKGAVEGVLDHCVESLEQKSKILSKAEELSRQGYRLLGLAGKVAKATGERKQDESGLTFLALLAFQDPIRASAQEAIRVCQQEGIEIKMITGDHPLTAHAVADRLQLVHRHDAIYTGSELAKMSADKRNLAYLNGSIFSRVTPEQKYELVQALKERGLVVAMTGDGVNDAPAMRAADIGISMGESATDAARATAGMVLTKSDFSGVVFAVREGRRIFSNLRRSFSYLIAFHVPVVLLTFVPVLLGLGELLLPIHIILLELIVHPVSAFAFEGLESSGRIMNGKLLERSTLLRAVIAGVGVSLVSLGFFLFDLSQPIEVRRAGAFLSLLLGNVYFVARGAWPHLSRRVWITMLVLLLGTILIAFNSSLLGLLRLALPNGSGG